MIHLDLFSGIGGFAYAVDQIWGGAEHIFCDNDPFCRKVLSNHWPESEIYNDIRQITIENWNPYDEPVDLVTGGFPCQPFSQAGQRKGVDDDRYLWPEMLRVIRLTKPQWVIAENVSGLLTMQGGVVFEQVCVDLEAAGYEVQPFIIPAASVGAPHKRDRVWICAHANSPKYRGRQGKDSQANGISSLSRAAILPWKSSGTGEEFNWQEVAAELCSVDNGLSVELDELKLSKTAHSVQQIKAYGNAIVPQVALEIMKGMIL